MGRDIQYREAIVTFVDILGFKNLLKSSDASKIYNILQLFRFKYEKDSLSNFHHYGIDVKMDVHFFSDSVVRIKYIRDYEENWQNTASDEVLSLAFMQTGLLEHGILVRGACAKGLIYSDTISNILFGPALVEAYVMEDDSAVYPRIVLSEEVAHDCMVDMTFATQHWIKMDGLTNRKMSQERFGHIDENEMYNKYGWVSDAKLLGLDTTEFALESKLWYINCLWGAAHDEIMGIKDLVIFNKNEAPEKVSGSLSFGKERLTTLVNTYLSMLSNWSMEIESIHTDERIMVKLLWNRFQLRETIKDIYEWVEGFGLSFLLARELNESLAEQTSLFYKRYACDP